MSETLYAHVIRKLLPRGKAWEFATAASARVWDSLVSALSQEPQRVEDDAYGLLDKVIPDNANTDLDFWEEIVGVSDEQLTDEERLARIRAILYGPPDVNLASLQTQAQLMANDANVRLFNRAFPPAAAGVCNAGDSLAVGEWDFTAACELYLQIALQSDPDDFAAWTGFVASSFNSQQSPVTLLQSAARVTLPGGGVRAGVDLDAPADSELFCTIWARPVTTERSILVELLRRDGTTVSTTFTCMPDVWHKLTFTPGSVGSGGTTPRFRVGHASVGNIVCDLSWSLVGVSDQGLQERIAALFPVHTRVHFGVQGEFETILSHEDQLEVTF